MALKSESFEIRKPGPKALHDSKAKAHRYRAAMEDVVEQAKNIARERRRALDEIQDTNLRLRAAD